MTKLILLISALLSLHARADLVDDLESPVTTNARWILMGGTAATLLSIATRPALARPFETSQLEHQPLGQWSKLGDYAGQWIPNVLYAGGTLIAYGFGNRYGLYRAKLMVEASLYAAAVATVLKYTVREGRPYNSKERNSFPSGHTATAFAFAGAIAAEHGWAWGVPAMALATFVGYSRINDHKHHVHDVLAGATLGLTAAYGVWYAQKPEREKIGDAAMILPMPLNDGAGISLSWAY